MCEWTWYLDSGGDVWFLSGDRRTAIVRKVRVDGRALWEWECGDRMGWGRSKKDAMAEATRWSRG